MSKLYKGEINFSVGIKQTGAVPLDDRTVVTTFNDLLSPDTFGLSAYAGMLVAVLENKQVFMLVDKAKPNLPKSWVAVGDLSEADIKDIEDKIDEVKKISTGNSEDIKNIEETIKKMSDNDTKNTAGSSESVEKLFLIGAKEQNESGTTTYSNSNIYASGNTLYIGDDNVLVSNDITGLTENFNILNQIVTGNSEDIKNIKKQLSETVEYGDAIEITDSVVNVKVQENDNYLKINDDNELVVSEMKTDDTKFGKNITIAGGPLASIAKQVYTGGTVPQGTSIQEFFENLLCVEIYPTATTSSGSFSITFTSAPSITNTNGISSGSLQEVGTKINFKEIIAKVVTESKTNPKVSGFTYGYSDTIDGTIVGGPTSITTTISASQKTGETYNLTASKSGFEGTMQTSASNTNYSSCKLSGTTLTVSYGNNSYTVSESAPKYQYSYKEITSKYIVSNLGNRDENKKSPAISALLATDSNRPTTASTFTVTGVYPIFTNGVSASTDGEVANNSSKLNAPVTGNGTKLALMKSGSTFAVSFASQTLEPYRLFLPGNWKITSAQALDGFTNKYSIDCKAKFVTNGTTTRNIQGNDVTYSIYEWTGYDGANCVKFTVA